MYWEPSHSGSERISNAGSAFWLKQRNQLSAKDGSETTCELLGIASVLVKCGIIEPPGTNALAIPRNGRQ